LDSLKLVAPVLAGHSLGVNELTTLGSEHPDRVGGLVYLDAGFDPTDTPASDPTYKWWVENLPPDLLTSLSSTSFPAAEWHNVHLQKNAGSVVNAITEGMKKRDYSNIRVPVLSFFATFRMADDPLQKAMPMDPELRAAFEEFEAISMGYIQKYEKSLLAAVPSARIVELPGATHYVFLSNEADVLREMTSFISHLPARN
jgi:non-heme chloroperoxidase